MVTPDLMKNSQRASNAFFLKSTGAKSNVMTPNAGGCICYDVMMMLCFITNALITMFSDNDVVLT